MSTTFRAHQLPQRAGDPGWGGGQARQSAVLDALFGAYVTDALRRQAAT